MTRSTRTTSTLPASAAPILVAVTLAAFGACKDGDARTPPATDAAVSLDAAMAHDAAKVNDAGKAHDAARAQDAIFDVIRSDADPSVDAVSSADATGDGGPARTTSLPLQGTVIQVAAFTEAAVLAAIALANTGDTVDFPGGTYDITTTVTLKPGILYRGEPGAILHNGTGATIFTASGASVDGLSLDGLTFDGGNVVLEGDTTTFSSNVTMINCTVENVVLSTNFGQMQGVLLDHIEHSRFDYNYFTNDGIPGQEAYAIIVYTTNDTSFSHNTLTTTYQGFHFESADTTGGNALTVSDNTATGLLAIGIEFNKNASNAIVEGNHLSQWRSGNANGMAFSIVPTGTNNTVTGNHASGVGCATCNIGLEANGTNSFFENNVIDGFYTNIAISCAPGSVFSGNTLSNAGKWGTFDKDGGYCTGYTIGTNDINGVETMGYTL